MISYKSWPFKEARNLKKRFKEKPAVEVTFETGFGPSGLPHIGTLAEIVRTTWVRRAFEFMTGWPTRLIAFSDDMDGLRKVPLNMPQQEMLAGHIGRPLCKIPDPFGQSESYSAYMNDKLQEFLDDYDFEYKFQSSYDAYTRGDFDEGLTIILRKVDDIRSIILPTMRKNKRKDWSPFFPVCENCGRVYSTRVVNYHVHDDAIEYVCDRQEGLTKCCGHRGKVSVLGGKVKVGWKVDWALRWYSYDVDYEMYGKDLIESAQLSGKIVRLMGKRPPSGFYYELFLDEKGRKISKSVGRGLTVDLWNSYAPLESLLYYLYQNPGRAKRLFWDIVPKAVDDYLAELRSYPTSQDEQPDSSVWHIFNTGKNVPTYDTVIDFSTISNLISGLGTGDIDLVLEYLERYDSSAKDYHAVLEDLVQKASAYYQDFILPNKHFRSPTAGERQMLQDLRTRLARCEAEDEEGLQALPFETARAFGVQPRAVFQAFYEVVLGQGRGPRFGSLAHILGKDKVVALLDSALDPGTGN
jgi:lysyl-tRNA synthetase class 1